MSDPHELSTAIQSLRPTGASLHGNWFQQTWRGLKRTKYLQLLMLAPLVWLVIFRYIPIYGVTLAFKDYSIREGILGSPWVGFEHFRRFFEYPYVWRIIRNTLLLRFLGLIFGFPAPIILALALNEVRSMAYKRFVQTVSYLPHFISLAAIVGIMTTMLSPVNGYINAILNRVFGIEPIYFFMDPAWFRPLYIGSSIWQNVGWGAIVYLAALSRVDEALIDAATIDGCNRWRKIWHINIPTITPTIIILLLFSLGQMLTVGAEKVILMYNPGIYETADVIQTYVYRRGILHADFSYATAVGLFNSMANLVLLVVANYTARRFSETSLW